VLRMANRVIHEIEAGGEKADVHVSGKKGIAYFKFAKRAMAETYTALGDNPKYAEVEKLADRFLEAYVEGKIDGLRVVYQQFISAGQQRPAVLDILPLSGLAGNGSDEAAKRRSDGGKGGTGVTTYDFSPEPVKLLEELIPITVKVSLFQAFIESAVSEQIARMVAMKAATDNADKMTKRLTQEYNRARQSQITSELSELMGGVEALK